MDFGGSHALFYASPVDLSPECKGKAEEMGGEPVSVILWNGVTPIQGLSENGPVDGDLGSSGTSFHLKLVKTQDFGCFN
jgi:hypothetical protein